MRHTACDSCRRNVRDRIHIPAERVLPNVTDGVVIGHGIRGTTELQLLLPSVPSVGYRPQWVLPESIGTDKHVATPDTPRQPQSASCTWPSHAGQSAPAVHDVAHDVGLRMALALQASGHLSQFEGQALAGGLCMHHRKAQQLVSLAPADHRCMAWRQ
jgi:hypothetical protein